MRKNEIGKNQREKESNEILFWVCVALLSFTFLGSGMLNVTPVSALELLDTTEFWVPIILAHAPYAGSCTASTSWTSTKSEMWLTDGSHAQSTSGWELDTDNGKTQGAFQVGVWRTWRHYHDVWVEESFKGDSGPTISFWLYSSSQQHDCDDICEFYYDTRDSIYFDHRYHSNDFYIDTRYGGPINRYIGGSKADLYELTISVSYSYYSGGVGTGVFSSSNTQSASWEWKYTFPSGRKWYIDQKGTNGMYTFYYAGQGGGGGGCPYVSPWNGEIFEVENNLLLKSLSYPEQDVEDWYQIQHSEPIRDDYYALQLQEFENEESELNNIKLLTVDYPKIFKIGINTIGEVVPYLRPIKPKTAVDSHGNDVLPLVENENDDLFFEGEAGESLILNFGRIVTGTSKLIMRSDAEKQSLNISVNNGEGWIIADTVIPRANWATDIIDLSNYLNDKKEAFLVRIDFTKNHKIDFMGLEKRDFPSCLLKIQEAPLEIARYNGYLNVTNHLIEHDDLYAPLSVGEDITLYFEIPAKHHHLKRDLILYVCGQYRTLG